MSLVVTIHTNKGVERYPIIGSKPLLHSLTAHPAMPIKVGCKGGGCGVCKVRIVSGNYDTKVMSKAHISETDAEQGYALACRVLPQTDLTIEVLAKSQDLNIETT